VNAPAPTTSSGRPTDPTAALFAALGGRHEPALKKARGTIRFDLRHGSRTDHWRVEIDRGDIAVTRKQARAESVVRAEKSLFDRIARGEVNAWAAMLRGAIGVEGDPQVLVLVQRLLPGPPASARGPSAATAGGTTSR